MRENNRTAMAVERLKNHLQFDKIISFYIFRTIWNCKFQQCRNRKPAIWKMKRECRRCQHQSGNYGGLQQVLWLDSAILAWIKIAQLLKTLEYYHHVNFEYTSHYRSKKQNMVLHVESRPSLGNWRTREMVFRRYLAKCVHEEKVSFQEFAVRRNEVSKRGTGRLKMASVLNFP